MTAPKDDSYPLILLSPHRSGSSAVMGLFAAAGLHLGEVLEPKAENPKGFFESVAVKSVNSDMLRAMGRDWTCPPRRLDPEVIDDDRIAATLVSLRPDDGRPWGFKEPRTLFTLEAWLPHIPHALYIGVHRDVEGISRSLQRRDGFSSQAARDIADLYLRRLGALHRELSFPLIRFGGSNEQLLEDVAHLAEILGLDWDQALASQFLEPGLIHHRTSDDIDGNQYLVETPKGPGRLEPIHQGDVARALRRVLSEALPEIDRYLGPSHADRRSQLWNHLVRHEPVTAAVLELIPSEGRRFELPGHVDPVNYQTIPIENVWDLREEPPRFSHVLGADVLDAIAPDRLERALEILGGLTTPEAIAAVSGRVVDGNRTGRFFDHRLGQTFYRGRPPYWHQRDEVEAAVRRSGWHLAAWEVGPLSNLTLARSEALANPTVLAPYEMRELVRASTEELKELTTRESELVAELQTLREDHRARLTELSEARTDLEETATLLERAQSQLEKVRQRGRVHESKLQRALVQAEAELAEAKSELSAARTGAASAARELAKQRRQLARLRGRRIVRIALLVARPFRPAFRVWRRLRKGPATSSKDSARLEGVSKKHVEFDVRRDRRTRRSLRWRRRTSSAYEEALVSVVMPTFNRSYVLAAAIDSVIAQTHRNWELIVVDDGSTDDTSDVVEAYTKDERIQYVRMPNRGVSAARNRGLQEATGDIVAYLDSDNTWDPEYLLLMTTAMLSGGQDCAYAALEVVDDQGNVRFFRGDDFDWHECRKGNYIDLNVFCHRRSLLEKVDGFDEKLRRMVDWDFILRATKGSNVAYIPFVGCRYLASATDPIRITTREPNAWGRVLRTRHTMDGDLIPWSEVSERLRLTFALKIAAPIDRKQEWGDYHFASSLAREMEGLGHSVEIQFVDSPDVRDCDVSLVLRGLTEFHPVPGAINLIWNISHPDKLGLSELQRFDAAYAASQSHARFLSLSQDHVPVKWLPQCTDTSRFNLAQRGHPSAYTAEVLFVGNSRNDYREMVRWALEADLDIEIYGHGWRNVAEVADDPRIHHHLIDNSELGAAYANSGVVLNDHWESMSDFGIISNRVFDVTATGSRLISDDVEALGRLFGSSIRRVSSSQELRLAVEDAGPSAQHRSELAQWVSDRHSFGARAREIVDDVLEQLSLERTHGTSTENSLIPFGHTASKREILRVGVIITHGAIGPQSSAFVRLIAPLSTEKAMDRLEIVEVSPDDIATNLDFLIVQRTSVARRDTAEEVMAHVASNGVRLIVDVDDAFRLIGEDHPQYEIYRGRNEPLEFLMANASRVWFSSDNLAQLYADANSGRSSVIRNSIDPRIWRHYGKNTSHPPQGNLVPRLLLMGTRTHDRDFEVILPALDELARDFAFKVSVVGALRERAPDRSWLEAIPVPLEKSVYSAFPRWLRAQGTFDIGLSPLCDTPFNGAKSDIKFLDYSALGLLSVLSDLPPYQGEIRERDLAILAADDEWASVLADVLENHDEYEDTRRRASDYVWRERTVDSTTEAIIAELDKLSG